MKAATRPGLELAVSSCPSPAWPEVPAPHPREGARDGGAPSPPGSSSHSSRLPGDPHLARKHLLAQGRAPDPDSRSPAGLGPSSGWAHRWSCCSRLSGGPDPSQACWRRVQALGAEVADQAWAQGRGVGSTGQLGPGEGDCSGVGGERLSLPGPLTLPPAPLPREQQPAAPPAPSRTAPRPSPERFPVPSARVCRPPRGLCVGVNWVRPGRPSQLFRASLAWGCPGNYCLITPARASWGHPGALPGPLCLQPHVASAQAPRRSAAGGAWAGEGGLWGGLPGSPASVGSCGRAA